jgi:glycosyltransferase involved in cell wall biosynthesis
MRVALLSRAVFPLHGYGGLERHVAALEKYLRREGCEVTLYTSPAPESVERPGTIFVPYRSVPWPRGRGFTVLDRDTNYLGWSLHAGKRALAEARADIVQADGGAGFGYAWSAPPGSPPLILHPHGMEEFHSPPLKRALYFPLRSATRYAARRAARVLAPDASMKGSVLRNLGVDESRVALVPNAVDLEGIDRKFPPAEPGLPREHPVLLSVGRIESNKGLRVLARALASLAFDFRWVHAGDGPERGALEAEIARSGLGRRARLLGPVAEDELHALFERATLFVHPTLYEGSSQVTLEAMAHRKAVVATRVGGIPDKVVEGETGLLVPARDPEALARAIAEALSSPDRLKSWGENGRRRVEERFSWSRRVKELLDLYAEVLGPGRAR